MSHGRDRAGWSLRSLPAETIPWFWELHRNFLTPLEGLWNEHVLPRGGSSTSVSALLDTGRTSALLCQSHTWHRWFLCNSWPFMGVVSHSIAAARESSSVDFNTIIYACIICQDLLVRTAEYVLMSGCNFWSYWSFSGFKSGLCYKNHLQGDNAFKICIMMSVSPSQVVSILSYSVKDWNGLSLEPGERKGSFWELRGGI